MYYILVNQIADNDVARRRYIITVANKDFFADLKDEWESAKPPVVIMENNVFNDLLKNGYPTRERAVNDKKMIRKLENYIGPFFEVECAIIDDKELKSIYKKIKNQV